MSWAWPMVISDTFGTSSFGKDNSWSVRSWLIVDTLREPFKWACNSIFCNFPQNSRAILALRCSKNIWYGFTSTSLDCFTNFLGCFGCVPLHNVNINAYLNWKFREIWWIRTPVLIPVTNSIRRLTWDRVKLFSMLRNFGCL